MRCQRIPTAPPRREPQGDPRHLRHLNGLSGLSCMENDMAISSHEENLLDRNLGCSKVFFDRRCKNSVTSGQRGGGAWVKRSGDRDGRIGFR